MGKSDKGAHWTLTCVLLKLNGNPGNCLQVGLYKVIFQGGVFHCPHGFTLPVFGDIRLVPKKLRFLQFFF